MGGDSFAQPLGVTLARHADALALRVTPDGRIATGLVRPEYFNWPAHLAEVAAAGPPEAVVMFAGANDYMNMLTKAGLQKLKSPGWRDEYGRRVGAAMDAVKESGAIVYWVGLPVMRDPERAAVAAEINAAIQAAAAARPFARFVDIAPRLADEAGAYQAFLPGADDADEKVRAGDGIHLTWDGTERVADAVEAALAADWGLAR